jgi:hypothetical protein
MLYPFVVEMLDPDTLATAASSYDLVTASFASVPFARELIL